MVPMGTPTHLYMTHSPTRHKSKTVKMKFIDFHIWETGRCLFEHISHLGNWEVLI